MKVDAAVDVYRSFRINQADNWKQAGSRINACLAIAANANAAVLTVIKDYNELKERVDAIDASEGVVGIYPNRLRLPPRRPPTPSPPISPHRD